ncbi:MAG TPA: HAD-IIB family hydrolase [Clostridiaceae bacterium]|nr:HAD-IIB family hydrolase [Clostridiaceae bacterium]
MKNIIYFDIDGTLWDVSRNFKVSDKTRKSIAKLQAKGDLTIINTGRSLASIPQEILDLNFDGIIAGCGTYVEVHGTVVHNELLDEDLIGLIVDIFSRERTDLLLEGPEHIYTMDAVFNPIISRNAFDLFDVHHRRKSLNERPVQINKISYLINDPQSDQAIIDSLQHKLDFIVYPSEIREGLPLGSSKGTGMRALEQWLQQEKDIIIDTTYAFGDSMNDIEMLAHANVGIAMGNSDPCITRFTNFETRDVMDEGIEHALLHFQLI